ncbi:hypothetical protein AB0M48_12045 [Lentzea sp. NPDC051208]|uniref:hypothetical protein n=1 Tax=Lentzea sp. NPDC051208 TaxID=3154642 RepID=UPI0034319DFB
MPAARQAMPRLGARRKHGGVGTDYLGAVVVATASNLAGSGVRLASLPQGAGLVPMMVKGTRDEVDVLTPAALARLSTWTPGA